MGLLSFLYYYITDKMGVKEKLYMQMRERMRHETLFLIRVSITLVLLLSI
jgi:hypothetical protein